MTETTYQAPPAEAPVRQIGVLESEHGRIVLQRNHAGYGYRLSEDTDGFGPGLVENELTPRLGHRGSMLGPQHEAAGTMVLPIIIATTTSAELRRMTTELTRILKLAEGTSRISLVDEDTGEGRYRDIAYVNGLESPEWKSPYSRKYVIEVDYLDPWAYSPHTSEVTLSVAPGVSGGVRVPLRFPVRFARSPGAVERWGVNEGEQPAPVALRFDGPVEDPVATLQGHWTFRVNGSLAYDEYLMVDPRDASARVYNRLRNTSRPAYSMIRTGSRFGDLVIPPGQHAFSFSGLDTTFTASMTASWPHTYRSMQ